jgi:very-short-patch-repair endonuclease
MAYHRNQRLGSCIYHGTEPDILANARENRRNLTSAEYDLWQILRSRRLNGIKFRRQHPVEQFIVDFYCHEAKLVIEVDGGYHDRPGQAEADKGRERRLAELGLTVIRFTNEEVMYNIDLVRSRIERVILEMTSRMNNEI